MSYTPSSEPYRPDAERQWSILVHVIAGGLNVITGGLFTGLIAAVIAFFLLKDRGPLVRGHAATTLNFQITLMIGEVIGLILLLIVIGWAVLFAIWVINIIFSLQGAITASRGQAYVYPLSIPFFK